MAFSRLWGLVSHDTADPQFLEFAKNRNRRQPSTPSEARRTGRLLERSGRRAGVDPERTLGKEVMPSSRVA